MTMQPKLDVLIAGLSAKSVEERLRAAEQIADVVGSQSDAPFDVALGALRAREPDRHVRRALLDARRTIARARGRARGLRAPVPTIHDEMNDSALVWSAIEIVWDAVSIYEGPEVLARDLGLATGLQRGLYASWWTDSEVRNGGFHQYFWNSTGVVAPFALEGFRVIGAERLAAALAGAVALFGNTYPAERAARHEALEGFDQDALGALNAHTDAYYAATQEFIPRAAAYVRAHLGDAFELRR